MEWVNAGERMKWANETPVTSPSFPSPLFCCVRSLSLRSSSLHTRIIKSGEECERDEQNEWERSVRSLRSLPPSLRSVLPHHSFTVWSLSLTVTEQSEWYGEREDTEEWLTKSLTFPSLTCLHSLLISPRDWWFGKEWKGNNRVRVRLVPLTHQCFSHLAYARSFTLVSSLLIK